MFSHYSVTQYLLDLGLDVNIQNYIGRTALMKAIYLCDVEKTRILLSSPKIDIELKDVNERNALHMSCWGDEGGRKGKIVNNQ